MFVLIDKIEKRCYTSYSKKSISNESGVKYNTLDYWCRKGYYENEEYVFTRVSKHLVSEQGKHSKGNPLFIKNKRL